MDKWYLRLGYGFGGCVFNAFLVGICMRFNGSLNGLVHVVRSAVDKCCDMICNDCIYLSVNFNINN